MISEIVYWLQIVAAVVIIVFVVLQPSKGSDLGSMAGGSTSNGNKTFVDPLTKITGFILALFMALSFFVSYIEVQNRKSGYELPTYDFSVSTKESKNINTEQVGENKDVQ